MPRLNIPCIQPPMVSLIDLTTQQHLDFHDGSAATLYDALTRSAGSGLSQPRERARRERLVERGRDTRFDCLLASAADCGIRDP
jgi:hypothetical protein